MCKDVKWKFCIKESTQCVVPQGTIAWQRTRSDGRKTCKNLSVSHWNACERNVSIGNCMSGGVQVSHGKKFLKWKFELGEESYILLFPYRTKSRILNFTFSTPVLESFLGGLCRPGGKTTLAFEREEVLRLDAECLMEKQGSLEAETCWRMIT